MATINIKVNGNDVKAYQYATAPKKGHHLTKGKLDGKDFDFACTKGKGRGTTMVYCAYFKFSDKEIFYFYTDGGYLPEGATVVTPRYDESAKPAAKKAPAKRAKATA